MVIDSVEFPVEEGKLREFKRAVGTESDTVPLTFSAVAGHWRDSMAMIAKLELELPRLVVGGCEWSYHAPIAAGDRLRGDRVVVSDERRKHRIVTLETALHKADGTKAVTVRETIIELA